ncbi:MAG TPA: ABC transporter ATP-binding protein [Gallicola sp.]|nr:ABC transporter ATP-binding protein [Gallicola sp.]
MSYVIEMCNITKIFPGIIANDNITLQLKKGEIHALLGENGAGKSTLMNVLFGLYTPEKGEIKKNGKIIKINGPNDANKLAIGMVHQHFMLVDNFTVLQNIVLGDEPIHKGFLSLDKARKKVIELSEKYKLEVDPDALVRDITVGMQQRVEILKMLYRDNEILIFDEPTAVLTPQEIEELLKIMKNLANEGKSILFITHKLDEIKKVADSCTVLRKGKYIGTVEVSDVSKEELSEMMVGHEVKLKVDKEVSNPGEVILSVENISMEDKFGGKEKLKNISFKIRAGEIVCIAGIDGNGQSELVYALSGLEKVKSGEIKLNNKDITNLSVRNRFLEGMAHIPEDRHKFGLVLDYNLAYNLVLHSYFEDAYQKFGFLNYDEIYKHADEMINKFDIRSSQGSHTIVRTMSGGNQQKAVIAREIISNPDLLIAVQPTRGLDVGAIEQVHRQLVEERDKGKAILLVSLELDEVMNVSDRILVMYEGELVADVEPKSVTYQELGIFMSGAKRGENYG